MLIIVYCVAITLGLCLYWILHTEQARGFLVIHHNFQDCDRFHNRVPRDEAQAPLLNSPQSSPSNCGSSGNSPCSTQQCPMTREVVLSDSRLVGQITRHSLPPTVPPSRRLTTRALPTATSTTSTARYPVMGDRARKGSYRPARLFRSNCGGGGTLVTPNGVTVLRQGPAQNEYIWPAADDEDVDDDGDNIEENFELTEKDLDEVNMNRAQNDCRNVRKYHDSQA